MVEGAIKLPIGFNPDVEGFVPVGPPQESYTPGQLPPTVKLPANFNPDAEGFAPVEKPSFWGSVKKVPSAVSIGLERAGVSMVKGIAGLALVGAEHPESLVSKIGNLFNPDADKAIKEWAEQMLGGVDTYFKEHQEEAVDVQSKGMFPVLAEVLKEPHKLAQMVFESAPLMMEGAVGTILGGPVGGIVMMGVPIAGDTYAEARKEGTSPNLALARALLTGAGEATIEQWTLGKKFQMMRMAPKSTFGNMLWQTGKAYWRGAAEEGSQEFDRNFWRWVFTDRSQKLTENVLQSAAMGGPAEMAMAGGFVGMGLMGQQRSHGDRLVFLRNLERKTNIQTDLTDVHKTEIKIEIDNVRQQVVEDFIDLNKNKYPLEIKDNVTLANVGDSIAQDFGITVPIKWVFKKGKGSSRWGLHVLDNNGEHTITVYNTPSHFNQDQFQETIVHELGHIVKPPYQQSQPPLISLPRNYIQSNFKNPDGTVMWSIKDAEKGSIVAQGSTQENAKQEALRVINRQRQYGRRQMHFPEFKKWVTEKVPDLYEAIKLSAPGKTYEEAIGKKIVNPWIRNTDAKTNKGRWLMVQISNKLLNPEPDIAAESYFNKLYAKREGYSRLSDFWEIPQWMASIAANKRDSDVYVVRDLAEAKEFLGKAGYDRVLFSVLDINKEIIRDLAQSYNGQIIAGGYGEAPNRLTDLPNVKVYPTVPDAMKAEGVTYYSALNFNHFVGSKTIPRLSLSKGCLYSCAFCTVPHGALDERPLIDIKTDADSIAQTLAPRLIYIDDKTFGQAKNSKSLPDVYKTVKKANPDFQGFIIQTTARDFLKLDDKFIRDAGIKYVEIGVESFNDSILKSIKKPVTEESIQQAFDKGRKLGVSMIPNIMIGLPGETVETYGRTLDFIRGNTDVISHINVYNLAVYPESEMAKITRPVLTNLKTWEGPAYRSDTGYNQDKGTTAGDVVRFEQDELGNDYGITEKQLKKLDAYPAKDIIWVGRTKESVAKYGIEAGREPTPEEIQNIPGDVTEEIKGGKIVAEDGEGGYLVLKKSVSVVNVDENKVGTGIHKEFSDAITSLGEQLLDKKTAAETEAEVAKSQRVQQEMSVGHKMPISMMQSGFIDKSGKFEPITRGVTHETALGGRAELEEALESQVRFAIGKDGVAVETLAEKLTPEQINRVSDILKDYDVGSVIISIKGEYKEISNFTGVKPYMFKNAVAELTGSPRATREERIAEEATGRPSRRNLLILIHKIPDKMGLSEIERRDIMEGITGKRSAKDMTITELQTVAGYFKDQYKGDVTIEPGDRGKPIVINNRGTTMEAVMSSVSKVVDEIPSKVVIPEKISRRFGLKFKPGPLTWIKNLFVGIDNSTPSTLAWMLGGNKNSIFTEVFGDNFDAAKMNQDSHRVTVMKSFHQFCAEQKITSDDLAEMSTSLNPRFVRWQQYQQSKGTGTRVYPIKLGVHTFDFTMGELMDIYLASNQEDGLRHVSVGGLTVNGVETGALTETNLGVLRSTVEQNPKAVAIIKQFNLVDENVWKPSINNVSLRLENKEIATVDKWWGLEIATERRLGGKSTGFNINLIENKGILKDRTKSGLPLVVRDAFDRFVNFEQSISEYFAMSEPLRIARTVLNDRDVSTALRNKGYGQIRENLRTILERTQSVPSKGGAFESLVAKITHGAYRAVLYFNPRVWASQFTSIFNYSAYVDSKYMSAAKQGLIPRVVDEVMENSDTAWHRYYLGTSSFEMGELGAHDATMASLVAPGKGILGAAKNISDINKLGILLKYCDITAIASGWKIAEAEYADAQAGKIQGESAVWWDGKRVDFKPGTEGWKQVINERANWLWNKTQPSWDKWNRSMITSEPSILKRQFFLFRSFHEKSLNIVQQATIELSQSKKTNADIMLFAKRTGAVWASYASNVVFRAIIVAAMTQSILPVHKYITQMLTEPLDMFPVIGKILATMTRNFINLFVGERPEYRGSVTQSLPIKVIDLLSQAPDNFAQAAAFYATGQTEKGNVALKKAVGKTIEGVSLSTGVPIYDIRKIQQGFEEEPEPTGKRTKGRKMTY